MKNAKQTGTLCAVLKKELFFSTPMAIYLFALLGFMTIIPSYPTIVGIGYVVLAVFQADGIRRANKDLEFTLLLPTKRSYAVVGKTLFVVAIELLTLLFGAVGAVIVYLTTPLGNEVFIDGNFAYFGIALIGLGVYNAIYTAGFFKTGYKSGVPTILGATAFLLVYTVAEILVKAVPSLAMLDGYGADGLFARIITFVIGAIIYGALTVVGVKIGQKRFEKVSL